ncbi:MAG: Do family serine endopeptidase [Planctomycetota bacterium]|jgi:serine protease Do
MHYLKHLSLKRRWLAFAVAPVLVAAVAAASLPGLATSGSDRSASTGYAKSLSHAFREAAKDVQPSVVMIKADPTVSVRWNGRGSAPEGRDPGRLFEGLPFGTPFGDVPELKRFFEEMPQMPRRGHTGIGSGVIIDPSGIILTNNHVIDGRGEITVRLHDGREVKAAEVKSDPETDLAVIRIEGADDLVAARLGNSDHVEIGDWVLALGHPFGLEGTVTSGIISAKGRGIGASARTSFLQTDAAINPGNSGGPLVNLDGEVIGINTAISSSSGGNQGVGFAIPVNLAKWVGDQLVDHGAVRRAQLGVMIQPLTHDLAEQFGLEARQGVLVAEVTADTPAAESGLKPGDVIVEYAGQAVASPRELQAAVERSEVGAEHDVVVVRDGERRTLAVVPGERSGDAGPGQTSPANRRPPSRFDKLGVEVETLTDEVARHLNVTADHGVVITDVEAGGPADRAGLTAGTVVVQANRKPVATAEDFRMALDDSDDDGVLLLVRGEHGSRYVVVRTGGCFCRANDAPVRHTKALRRRIETSQIAAQGDSGPRKGLPTVMTRSALSYHPCGACSEVCR